MSRSFTESLLSVEHAVKPGSVWARRDHQEVTVLAVDVDVIHFLRGGKILWLQSGAFFKKHRHVRDEEAENVA